MDDKNLKTFCNPVDLNYRFGMEEPFRREAADPVIIWHKDRYYLFASKSSGYWHSNDLLNWELIKNAQLPWEEYAPTVVSIGDTIFFLASSNDKSTVYMSTNPLQGHWQIAVEELEMPVWDPALFLDDDQRLYLYWGCSDVNPLYGVEVDYKNQFKFMSHPVVLKYPNPAEFGWEVPGDYNTLTGQSPWIEGPWVSKHRGRYYLQYSGPGTEFKSYADGVYVSDSPLGPFNPQKHNPFAYKPEGFAAGAGHGSLFQDRYNNLWHIGTITISQKHIFERRLGLYPAFLDDDGTLYAITRFGDYPTILPSKKISEHDDIFPGWMLLSYGKNIVVSSALDSFPSSNLVDENIRSYWAAESGNQGEYAMIDLGNPFDIYALQLNFAEHQSKHLGRNSQLRHRYIIEHSADGETWEMLMDKSDNSTDNTHLYFQFETKVKSRFVRITNKEVPGGHFAMSGFRIFGKGNGSMPGKVERFTAQRNPQDRRSVDLHWKKSQLAIGYNIRYGSDRNKLYHNYLVYGDTSLTINSLNKNLMYFFCIEAFSENGVQEIGEVIEIK